MSFSFLFTPTKQRDFNKQIYGFDIETHAKNKKFLMASIVGDNFKNIFYNKRNLINFLKEKKFKSSYVAASNLGFDFMGLFYGSKEMEEFTMQFRGSDLIFAKTYIKNKEFSKNFQKNAKPLTFIDTFNYASLSVEKLGKIIGVSKIQKPSFLGQQPKNKKEWDEMIAYNLKDSEISKKAIEFFFESFSALGANPKLTIASTAMSLYKNQFLKQTYFRHHIPDLLNEFRAYYGANTHAYSRGRIKNYNYYDFNSLYPAVMQNEYPDPNTLRITEKNTTFYIDSFEGISNVEVFCPYMEYPFLPYRKDNKLFFPIGNFRGWFSHVELKKAIDLGYTIKKVYKTYYFKETCLPFRDYVIYLYEKRKEYQKDNNPMEYVVKILMNSLYGKFGQKFIDRDNWQPFNHTIEELNKLDFFERVGDFIRIKKPIDEPRSFCIPIWALYTTAYARIKLHDVIRKSRAIYCDTDSIITKKEYYSSDKLGELKLEHFIKDGIIVKPKFYIINGKAKIKGMGTKISAAIFMEFLKNPTLTYEKFMRFKESIRRGFIPNEIQEITKTMSLEDDKRIWDSPFDPESFQSSQPVKVEGDIIHYDISMEKRISEQELQTKVL